MSKTFEVKKRPSESFFNVIVLKMAGPFFLTLPDFIGYWQALSTKRRNKRAGSLVHSTR